MPEIKPGVMHFGLSVSRDKTATKLQCDQNMNAYYEYVISAVNAD